MLRPESAPRAGDLDGEVDNRDRRVFLVTSASMGRVATQGSRRPVKMPDKRRGRSPPEHPAWSFSGPRPFPIGLERRRH